MPGVIRLAFAFLVITLVAEPKSEALASQAQRNGQAPALYNLQLVAMSPRPASAATWLPLIRYTATSPALSVQNAAVLPSPF